LIDRLPISRGLDLRVASSVPSTARTTLKALEEGAVAP